MTLLSTYRKILGRYPKDTMRSVRIRMIPRFLQSVITFWLSIRSNRLVTLPPGLYKAGRDPLQTHETSYDSQYNPTDHMSRVLRHTDGLNLSNSCVSLAFLFLITRISADQSSFVGYPSEDCRLYSVDTYVCNLYSNYNIQINTLATYV